MTSRAPVSLNNGSQCYPMRKVLQHGNGRREDDPRLVIFGTAFLASPHSPLIFGATGSRLRLSPPAIFMNVGLAPTSRMSTKLARSSGFSNHLQHDAFGSTDSNCFTSVHQLLIGIFGEVKTYAIHLPVFFVSSWMNIGMKFVAIHSPKLPLWHLP